MPYRSAPYGKRYSGMFKNMISGTVDYYENGTKVLSLDSTGVGVGAYTLPLTDGSVGQVLKTNGSGALAWANDESA